MSLENLNPEKSLSPNSAGEVLTNPKYNPHTVEELEQLYPEGITKQYSEKITLLHAEFSKISNYLTSKKMESVIAKEVLYLLDKPPVSGVLIDEKMQDLKKYEQVIHSFEKNKVPEEVFRDARNTVVELNNMITEISKIQDVAENRPELN